jgi:hypothetical protein
MNDQNIMIYGADYVASNYAWEAAAFFWDTNNINNAIVAGQDEITTLIRVSNGVYRGNYNSLKTPGEWDSRQKIYHAVASII